MLPVDGAAVEARHVGEHRDLVSNVLGPNVEVLDPGECSFAQPSANIARVVLREIVDLDHGEELVDRDIGDFEVLPGSFAGEPHEDLELGLAIEILDVQ